jgi:hypothetical protein
VGWTGPGKGKGRDVGVVPRGLINTGNMCFANTVSLFSAWAGICADVDGGRFSKCWSTVHLLRNCSKSWERG